MAHVLDAGDSLARMILLGAPRDAMSFENTAGMSVCGFSRNSLASIRRSRNGHVLDPIATIFCIFCVYFTPLAC